MMVLNIHSALERRRKVQLSHLLRLTYSKPSQKQKERDEQNMRQKSKKAKKRGKPLERDQKRTVAVATRTASQLWPAAFEKESQSGGHA